MSSMINNDSFEKRKRDHEKNSCLGKHFWRMRPGFSGLSGGALIWGLGILRDKLPIIVEGGEKVISVAVMKLKEILPE